MRRSAFSRLLALALVLMQGTVAAYGATPLMASRCECAHGADVDCDCPHHAGKSTLPACHRHARRAAKEKPAGFHARCGASKLELQLLPGGEPRRIEAIVPSAVPIPLVKIAERQIDPITSEPASPPPRA